MAQLLIGRADAVLTQDTSGAFQTKKCNMVISGIFITADRLKQFPAAAYMKTHRAPIVQGLAGETPARRHRSNGRDPPEIAR